ncbi:MAG: alpha/beta fold hydrolase [Mycobacteriaceae bacterium]
MTKAGTGDPPLVFVHGFACDGTDWQAQVDALATRTTVVVCELPGHGSSPGTPAECTIEAYGIAVARALMELELRPAILVGHSMGCRVVLEASRVQPYAVSGLVLVDGSRIGEGDPIAAQRAMAGELAGDGSLLARALAPRRWYPRVTRPTRRSDSSSCRKLTAPHGQPRIRSAERQL